MKVVKISFCKGGWEESKCAFYRRGLCGCKHDKCSYKDKDRLVLPVVKEE